MEQLREQQKLRPGAAVTANIYCGRRSLGYVLLHDLISFVQVEDFVPVLLAAHGLPRP